MSDKRYMHPFVCDVAVRLELIAKVNGIEQAENYFNNTPKLMRTCEVYGALLYSYAHVKCVDKAEGVVEKMREFGFPLQTINYNALLKLYCQTRNNEKVDALIHEMEKKQIKFDKYTYSILLNTYVPESDSGGIEKILMRIDTDADLNIDWATYADVANRFLGAGSVDKALKLLKKSEKLVAFAKNKNDAFSNLLTMYATAGKKEEVLRMWNECKKLKVRNRDYMCMLSSILKFDDIENAEKIYEEWEAGDLSKDIRVSNFLISFYCKNDLVEKAEALMESLKSKNWEKANASTWCWMSFAYVKSNQMLKAVKSMESSLVLHYPGSRWKLDKKSTEMCLKYLKEEGDVNRSSNVVRLLKDNGIISEESHERLLAYFSGDHALEDGLLEMIQLQIKTK